MIKRLPPLNALRAFEAAARHMSFKAAAEELNVTPAALSYQIRLLEDELNVKLFTRLNRAVELTQDGKMIRPYVKEAFEQFNRAIQQLNKAHSQNVLNIAAGPALTAKFLAPRLYKFLAKHPEIDVRISASLQLVDLQYDDIDIALRFGEGEEEGCTAIKFFDEYLTPLCSPELLEGPKPLRVPADLKRFTLIHDDTHKDLSNLQLPSWSAWLQAAGIHDIDTESGLHFNLADHALNAAVAGSGVVLGRETLAKGDIETKRLVAPFKQKIKAGFAFYAMFLERRADETNIKQFCDWLLEEANS